MTSVRAPAVAGQFYPGNAAELSSTIKAFLDAVDYRDTTPPKAIIAPHAGYIYSGAVAAKAYARIAPVAGQIRRVVLLGPCHRVAVRGLALSGDDYFETPLGRVAVDKDAAAEIMNLPQVQVFDATHEKEHSLEVHIPFLQTMFKDFTLVPLVVGETPPEQVAEVLDKLWGGDETLIVVSSDLSHFLDYDSAREIDQRTTTAIEQLDPGAIERDGACGRFPVGGLLRVAERRGMSVETVDICNSGDTAGTKERVVGYGAWVFTEPPDGRKRPAPRPKKKSAQHDFEAETKALLQQHGGVLLKLSAMSILYALDHGTPPKAVNGKLPEALREDGAVFVTLKHGAKLRGCIGSPQAHRPLVVDVVDNAYKAAFKDPRFKPLTEADLAGLDLSVSVLSPQTPMTVSSEEDLLQQLRPGKDGLVIADGNKRALFLPSVWDQLPTPEQFLGHLKTKARMAADHWSAGFKAWRFIAEEVKSGQLADPDKLWQRDA